jgi:D-serine deaminase-like pyridoxal phosphate-dependent protein
MNEAANWYQLNNTDQVDSPALLLYPARVRENIRLLKAMIDDPQRLRPHVKTHKSQQAIFLLLAEGIRKFKCATIAEAEMLGLCQAPDVLLAYHPVGPKLQRLVDLVQQYPATLFSCLTDNEAAAALISTAARTQNLVMPVYIDVNVGMNRTGIAPGAGAIALYEKCMALPGLRVMGLHVYDGHIHAVDLAARTQECQAAFAPVEQMAAVLKAKNLEVPHIIAGGTPTFPIHAQRPQVQCSPGTFIYWDKGYQDTLPEQPFLPAALLLARVISLPAENRICLDLGHKSVAAENPLDRRVYFLNAPEAKMVSQSEEHLVVEVDAAHSWQVGDVWYGLPIHICPTCALYEQATTVQDGDVTGTWKMIARDRKITI